jgi:hypothetical protein
VPLDKSEGVVKDKPSLAMRKYRSAHQTLSDEDTLKSTAPLLDSPISGRFCCCRVPQAFRFSCPSPRTSGAAGCPRLSAFSLPYHKWGCPIVCEEARFCFLSFGANGGIPKQHPSRCSRDPEAVCSYSCQVSDAWNPRASIQSS